MKNLSNTQICLTMVTGAVFGMFAIPALEEHYHVADKVEKISKNIQESVGLQPVPQAPSKAPTHSQ